MEWFLDYQIDVIKKWWKTLDEMGLANADFDYQFRIADILEGTI